MNNNPLAGYFRQPAIHMTLPSQGNFYPDGSLEMSSTGELPVFPMTALDEITYRTPDALFNGSALVDVIKSCIPAIIDPWEMPGMDMSAVMANIRIASFGHFMDIDTKCPKCGEESTYQLDLRKIVDSLRVPDYATPAKFGDITVFFRPLSYKTINENNKVNFQEQQLNKVIADKDMAEDEKIKQMSTAFKKISRYTLDTMVGNINSIDTPDASVTEKEYILDFLSNCDRELYKKIKDQIIELRSVTDIKPLRIICDNDECKYEYKQPFTMDMTTFFE